MMDYLEEGRTILCIRTKAPAPGDYEEKKRKLESMCSALA